MEVKDSRFTPRRERREKGKGESKDGRAKPLGSTAQGHGPSGTFNFLLLIGTRFCVYHRVVSSFDDTGSLTRYAFDSCKYTLGLPPLRNTSHSTIPGASMSSFSSLGVLIASGT